MQAALSGEIPPEQTQEVIDAETAALEAEKEEASPTEPQA